MCIEVKFLRDRIEKLENLYDQVDALLSMAKRIKGKAVDDGDYWEISDDVFQEVQKAFDEIKENPQSPK